MQKNELPKIPSREIFQTKVNGIPFAYHKDAIPLLRHIFQMQDYDLPIKNFNPRVILDCGANIGCSVVYFANSYPDAQIYGVEPQKDNFALLKYNSFPYKNIHIFQSALWDKETYIKVNDDVCKSYVGYMTFETTADDPRAFKTMTISQLWKQSGFDEIDLLKIDIEGAEKEVFAAPDVDEWLPKVKVMTIELHDRLKSGCSYSFFKAISKYHWHFEVRGENILLMREKS